MKKWKTVIKPETKLFDIPIRELWQYRSLVYMLVKRNYQVQYKQTILGPIWMFASPIFSSGLFSFVFGYVGGFSSDGIPYFLFYMSASILWGYFSGCVGSNMSVFLANSYLFGKVYFPRLVVPISNILFDLVRFMIQFAVCCCVWLFYFIRGEVGFTGWYLLLIPILVLESGLLGTAIGLIVTSMTTKYRDLTHLVNFGMQLLMYISPVLYPVSQLPESLQPVIRLNPMTSIIEAFRFCMTGSGMIHWLNLLYSTAVVAIILVFSIGLFNKTEKTFIDII